MLKVRVRVANPADPARSFEEDFWVDTGALYTFVPENRLFGIGLEPIRSRDLVLADGRRVRRLLGEAALTVPDLEETLTCPVVFAPPESLYLLGATALENFGVEVDTVDETTQKLKPILGIIGGFLGSRESGAPWASYPPRFTRARLSS